MKMLRNKIEFVVLVIIFHFNKSHAQSTIQLIPIPESLKFGPKTHERIIVPHFDHKGVSEVNELQAPSGVKNNVVERPNSRGRILYDGRRLKPLSYVNRHDGRISKNDVAPNEIQPLHIDTEVFESTTPNHTRESKDDKRKRFKLQEERIKMKKLPENPENIPTTTWFDNLGKYNYGIVHHAYNIQDVPALEGVEELAEGESKEVLQAAILPSQITTTPLPEIKFKSSFRDPNVFAQIHSQNDNMGKFLYKTQVYYPNYRDHVYLPVTTYYGDNQGITKDLPVYNAHTIIHNEPPMVNAPQDAVVHQNPNAVSQPKNNAKKPSPAPPKKTPPRVNVQKKEAPKKPGIQKSTPPPPPPAPKKEEPSAEEDYDYEEEDESDDDYDDGANNDKYRGNSNGNEEQEEEEDDEGEEEESEESSSDNRNKNSFTRKDSDESDEDQFDQAWSKFGYGQNKQSSESDSYESSESQHQPERIKIVHMKMEVQTTPIKYEEGDVESNEEEEIKRGVRSAEILEDKKKPKGNAKREGAKNQAQHPNAGPDDLKFFQYLSNLGNGEHRAGGRLGNDKHYVEQHERGNKVLGTFQKKVKWADKEGGFGEHYWDLNHG